LYCFARVEGRWISDFDNRCRCVSREVQTDFLSCLARVDAGKNNEFDSKWRLFDKTALTGWSVYWKRDVFPVKYKLRSYILACPRGGG
jgi:hypothetical protein